MSPSKGPVQTRLFSSTEMPPLILCPMGINAEPSCTASNWIDTHDFTAKHLTFQNDLRSRHTVGQALAPAADYDRNAL